jgi:hypothetical protein
MITHFSNLESKPQVAGFQKNGIHPFEYGGNTLYPNVLQTVGLISRSRELLVQISGRVLYNLSKKYPFIWRWRTENQPLPSTLMQKRRFIEQLYQSLSGFESPEIVIDEIKKIPHLLMKLVFPFDERQFDVLSEYRYTMLVLSPDNRVQLQLNLGGFRSLLEGITASSLSIKLLKEAELGIIRFYDDPDTFKVMELYGSKAFCESVIGCLRSENLEIANNHEEAIALIS